MIPATRDGFDAAMEQVARHQGRRATGPDLRLLVASVRSREAFRDLLGPGVPGPLP